MLFVEFRFLFFFLIVFGVYWTLRGNTSRKAWLLVCSYFFYACWDWRFLFLLMGSTSLDYIIGRLLGHVQSKAMRRALVTGSVCVNLGLLGFFKYFNFFTTSAVSLLDWMGLPGSIHTLAIILPVGLSFYTFQSMSYTIEIYRGHLSPVRKPLDLAFFIAFFPQLVAGPIVRATTFLPQVREARRFAGVNFRSALVLFLVGFVKKTCVAENVAPFVDQYFASPQSYSAGSCWIAVLLYAVQIYCDFSGYTDMAIACARMLGYELTINFNFPYFANSVADFWRRWHISLSTWLRDYLYISLGGNRGGKAYVYRNLIITMLLGGLWHGGAWTFVAWGGIHGVALVVQREWKARSSELAWIKPAIRWLAAPLTFYVICLMTMLLGGLWHGGAWMFVAWGGIHGVALVAQREGTMRSSMLAWIKSALRWLGTPLTFYVVCLAWIFFRAQNFPDALTTCRAFVFFDAGGASVKSLNPSLFGVFAALALIHYLNFRGVFSRWYHCIPSPIFAAGYGALAACLLPFVPVKYAPFIYFQF